MQIFKNSVFSFLRPFLSFFLLFIFPTIAFTQDFGVNIDRIYYQDNSGREIDYDFSAGIIDEYGTIVIPASAVKLVPDSETNTTFLWEQGFGNQQVSFSEGAYQISVPQATDTIKPISAVVADIILDGSESDWSGVAGYIEDHLNDVAQWVPAGSGADMHYLKVAFSPDNSKLYILMKLNDPVSQDAWYRLFLDKDLDGELDESGDYQIDIQYNNTSSSWEVVSQGWNSDGSWYQVEESGTVVVSDQIIEVSVSTGAFGLPADVVISGRTMQNISPYRTYDTFSNNYLEAEGFCSMGGSGVTAPLPSEWQFSARISNFSNVLFENNHFYGVSIGGGSSDPDDLEPSVWADWFSGTHNGVNYQNVLVFGAEVENDLGDTDEYHWEWHVEDGGGLVLTGLDPASTVLDLKLVVTSGGQTVSAYYRINSDLESGWTLLVTHTLPVGIGTIYGFYDIYPTIGLETGVENQSIATETDVSSLVGCVFPIAVTSGGEFGLNAAFDGTNYLAGIQGNEIASNNIAAQMVSQAGTLVGSTISIDRTGGLPHVAFDGVNYLLVWEDDANYPNDEIYGQFISQSGTLKGYPFPINQDASDDELYGLAFDGSNYLVVWKNLLDGGNEAICGQMVSQTGILVGSNILISGESLNQNWAATAFDGANYLIVWSDGTRLSTGLAEDIYGQFVTTAGGLVGQKFLIDQNDYPSDNFISIGFDGARYLVLFQDRINGEYDIYCRSVSTSGSIGDRIAISDTTGNQKFPSIAFDGNNYLITMSDDMGGTSITAKGRFYNVELNPLGDWFTLFEASGSKIPFASSVIFDGSKYLVVATTAIISGDDVADGDVYGVFVHSGSVGGDINNDKAVDLVDAILVLKALVGLSPVGINLGADVNGNNKIGLAEVIYVLQNVAGLRSAQISNIPPHATINIPASGATFNIGQVVDFEGSGLDTDGQVVSYKWNFGDESVGWEQTTSHSYNRPGSYTVTLIATDDNGATGVDSITVVVETIWYKDADGDGYSDGTTQISVDRPNSDYYEALELTAISGDCNDNDANIHPGEVDILFIDDFSSDLSAWIDMRGSDWSITYNELYGNYGISCGSTVCPQGDFILRDEYQPSGNYRASVDFIRTVDASHLDYFQAIGNFALWQDSNNKISISIGGSGWDSWGGQQSQIQVNIQEWDGSWETTLSETLDYDWDPDEWHTASIEKNGNVYSLFIDGVYLAQYEDTFLNGEGKIGLHTYGSKRLDNFRLETVNTAWENGFTISEVASFPVGLSDHTCSRIGDKIYVMGGRKTLDSDGFGTDEMYEFNPNNNQLNLLGNTLPYGMLWGMSSAVAGNGKICLGPAGGPDLRNGWGTHSKIVEYDTSTGIAIEKQAGYGTNMWGVSMAADSNGFIYLFGGHNGSDQNTIYKYDHNSDTMHLVSNLSYNTTGGTAILGANGKIYYFDVGRPGHKITLFDPSNNATSDVATIPSGFSFVGGAGKAGWADGENIYLLLVDDNENELRLFKFNTQTNEVTDTTQTIPLSISRYSVVKHNDSVYIIGGTDFVNNVISNKIYKLSFSETMSKNLLYLKSTITMIQGESGSQYQEVKSWEQAGYSVTTATFDTTTIDSLLLSNYEVLRINDYWNHDFTSSEGDAIYNWVITGGKLLTDVGWEATVPLVSNFGVESIGVHIWQDYPFHGAPLTFGPVSGPVGSVSKLAVEAIGYPALAPDHSLIVDTTYQGYPVVAHGEFGSGKVVLVLTAAGWSHDATFPGNAYQANIHQENNLEFLDNVIQYLDTN